jgi:diguanylate cyclase (GGDEF)-like protein
MAWISLRRHATSVVARIVLPMAAVLLSLLGLAVGGLIWAGQRTNDVAVERQRSLLGAALQAQADEVLADLVRVTGTPDAVAALRSGSAASFEARIAAPLKREYGLDHVSLDRLDAPVGTAGVRLARVTWAPTGPEIVATLAETAFASPDGRQVAVSATLPLSAEAIARIAAVQGLGDLAPAALPPEASRASLMLTDARGEPAGAFVWTPDKPGDLVLERVLPSILVALSAIALFSALMFGHVRRVTTELIHREAEATHLAHHDPLSGLPNRTLFAQRLDTEFERLERGGEGFALLYLDLDRFKEINDTYGHEAGDTVIRTIARRLGGLIRGADTLARFGGDEFAIIQTGVREPRESEFLARRILDAVRHTVPIAGGEAYVGVSIGIALAPANANSREPLMRLADVALYRAKHEGRNRYSFFETVMDETLRLRKIVEDDLRSAIERDELELRYQPQFSPDGRKILGVEALVRWNHPKRGMISPSDFVPIAEERGLISPLGEWVLRRAARDGRRWTSISVAVNVSPVQFRHKDFVQTVAKIIEDEGMDPTRLELELTEGVFVDDADAAEHAMVELRSLGVRMALDDFGTGYSSLIYLRRFAFDKIKIDRSFLESMETTGESAILVHSAVHLGRALGLTVTAEGVETEEQQRFLQAVGCHQLQGFLLCEPVNAEAIDRLLASQAEGQAPLAGAA